MKDKIYFPSLNGIRAIAAFLVIFYHIEQIKIDTEIPNLSQIPFFSIIGELGVTLFFVLSGFLITFLLFAEKKITNSISVREFYIRRILRIWPLYFFIIFLQLIIFGIYENWNMDYQFFSIKLFLYVFFLPNVATILYSSSGGFPVQLWSVGTEEQFYAVWPWIIKLKKSKYINILIFIIFLMIFFKLLLFFLAKDHEINWKGIEIFNFLSRFFQNFRIECMALGGLGAYLIFFNEKSRVSKILFEKITQIVIYIAVIILLILGIKIPIYNDLFYSIFFVIIIMNVSSNNKTIINFENKIFNFLGKISYGLYIYHIIILTFLWEILYPIFKENTLLFNILYSLVGLTLVVLVAHLSYKYFEYPFLRLKVKFSKIVSGDNTKENK
jgi:peptidoglycan/LPS O-acetylase OafA/YrhL